MAVVAERHSMAQEVDGWGIGGGQLCARGAEAYTRPHPPALLPSPPPSAPRHLLIPFAMWDAKKKNKNQKHRAKGTAVRIPSLLLCVTDRDRERERR